MSWTSRVKDNAQVRHGATPLLPWNPAATKTGHFRPHYSPAHTAGADAHEDAHVSPSAIRPSSSEVDVSDPPLAVGGGKLSHDPLRSAASEPLDRAVGASDSCRLPSINGASHDGAQTRHDSINTTLGTAMQATAVPDAQFMDPFVAHERQVAIALQAVRRDLASFLHTSYNRSKVVVPAAVDVVGVVTCHRAPSSAESPTSDPSGKKPVGKGKSGGSVTPPTLGGAHDVAAAVSVLLSEGLVSAHPRPMELRELQRVSERLSMVVASGTVSRPNAPDRGVADGTPVQAHKAPHPGTNKKKPHQGECAPTMEQCTSPPPLDVPDIVLQPLSEYARSVQSILSHRMRGVEKLQGALPPSSETPCDVDGPRPTIGERVAPCAAPCTLSKGLSLAAREIMHLVDHHPPVKGQRSPSSLEAGDDGASEAIAPPVCGAYVVGRTVATFGNCDASQISCYVIYGHHTPREAALLWCTRALMDAEDTSLLVMAPKRVCIGVGWQRSAAHGAITVCLATPWFDELRFTTQRNNMPMQEVARYINHGLTSREDRTSFPIKCLVGRYRLTAVAPALQPIEPTSSATIHIMLDVPLSVSIACSVVQLNAPPQTPFHGRRTVDAEIKEARRRGKPLKAVPLEPRYSTSSSLIDYPPDAGALTRITVRLVSHRPAVLHIFAKLEPHETSYTKAMSIDIRPMFSEEDWLADQGCGRGLDALGLPVVTEVFQRWRGYIVQPMLDTVESGVPTQFEVFLPKGTQRCFVKGSHGQTSMVPVDAAGSLTASTPSVLGEDREPSCDVDGTCGQRSPSHLPSLSTDGQALGLQHHTPMASPLRRRGGGTSLFRGEVHHPKEGPLQLWADGYLLCHWSVVL